MRRDLREIPKAVPFGDIAGELKERYQIKALPTVVDGVEYRSRLEARWATFFNAARIPFVYEPEGYDLNGIRYLPDFWLPEQKSFIEAKPEQPTQLESQKAQRLATTKKHRVFIFTDHFRCEHQYGATIEVPPQAKCFFPNWEDDDGYVWCECPQCGFLGISFEGRTARLTCDCRKRSDRIRRALTKRLQDAYRAARTRRWVL